MRVVLSEVGHRFTGASWLFRELSATLLPGHVYSLTGPSGSGKSTLLALLARWLPPTEGAICVPEGMRTGWVFQNPHGEPHRTARDHVAFPFLTQGFPPSEARSRAEAMLEEFGLLPVAGRAFRELSGGEAQRLMLARGRAAAPGLFLVDEPTAQLDREAAHAVNAAIGAIAAEQTIVVVATHDPDTRVACSDHLVLGENPDAGSAVEDRT